MMKKVLILIVTLMSVMASTPASAKTGTERVAPRLTYPTNIVVKQTTHFTDGRTLTIYYKKAGDVCELYSPDQLTDYNMDDATKIRSTTFEVVDNVEGRLVRKATVREVRRLVRQLVKQYL